MSDAKGGPNQDPSMDDILASIRKIISDDESRAQVGGLRNPSSGERPPVVPPELPSASPKSPRDDVLLLTEIVEEPEAMPNEQPAAKPRIDPVNAAEMSQPATEPATPEKPAARTNSGEALVGAGVAGATSSAFARLNQAVQDSVPAPAATDPGPRVGGSGQTIEDLVKEMLRPMLKEWLDTNLPPMVERYVEREIARLTRR